MQNRILKCEWYRLLLIGERMKAVRSLQELVERDFLSAKEAAELKPVTEAFTFAITETQLANIDLNDKNDPIRKQFIPTTAELKHHPKESQDPIGDAAHSPVKGIVHRYPDRCLFLPISVCAVYCRYCFRREKIGAGNAALTPPEVDAAICYIANNPAIFEVIFTGGDPLMLKPKTLGCYLERIAAISHVEIIRLHSRIPVVDPNRINAELLAALKTTKPVYLVLHANHAKEFTESASQACNALVDAGVPLLSQTVLLKGINDDIENLSALMRCFLKHRIKPYYLHHGDLALGTEHFRTSIAKGQALMRALRGRFSGLCQPTYVIDIPGGFGKMPIGPNYLSEISPKVYHVCDYNNQLHTYEDNAF